MAVSPVVVQQQTDIGVRGGKRLSIPMRTQGNLDKRGKEMKMAINSGKELAEQLNEETKKKYIKGEPTIPFL